VVITTCNPLWEAIGEVAGNEKNGEQKRLKRSLNLLPRANAHRQANRRLRRKG
jgi:hypothetical protein